MQSLYIFDVGKYEERKPKASSTGTKRETLKLLISKTCEPGKYMSRAEAVCGVTILFVWENGNNTN